MPSIHRIRTGFVILEGSPGQGFWGLLLGSQIGAKMHFSFWAFPGPSLVAPPQGQLARVRGDAGVDGRGDGRFAGSLPSQT